ncbi:hypothetical protein [Micromonospora sp. NPDC002575]|uniref:hypothetical protein n=1 Tax=Micromonospora sp. NPDC002575 TaxID=3364222 RepID=UPI0036BC3737
MDRQGVKEFGDAFFAGMPDLRHPLVELVADGDLVALPDRLTIMRQIGALPS